jgi:hypothetical protein
LEKLKVVVEFVRSMERAAKVEDYEATKKFKFLALACVVEAMGLLRQDANGQPLSLSGHETSTDELLMGLCDAAGIEVFIHGTAEKHRNPDSSPSAGPIPVLAEIDALLAQADQQEKTELSTPRAQPRKRIDSLRGKMWERAWKLLENMFWK